MSGSSSFLLGGGRAEAEAEADVVLKARSRSSSSSFFSWPVSVAEEAAVAAGAEEVDEEDDRSEPARLRTGAAVGGKPRG